MSRKTTFNELYAMLGQVVQESTGRKWWRKGGIQSQPKGPYATVYLTEAVGLENDIVSTELLAEPALNGEMFKQTPWGISKVDARIEFIRSEEGDTAIQASSRFRTALRLEERYFDLWNVMGLASGVQLIDISSIFRVDIEPRAEVRFTFYANITDDPVKGSELYDIQSQLVDLVHDRQDDVETSIPVTVSGNVLLVGEEIVYGDDGKPVIVENG